ncbi:AI-2E family transporter [Methylosinus sp. Sm6]|uniref:AI-2E family transporter n=1 Tax=Methylosinus sp. Sm6 TaxID=2866948 RepID=UPI001C99DDAD|nr:AI-2E family transporter [Methylosinus sp. Sm6]MBY6241904.1 AI-2E family transporter [Methylosinus sp. Sm6]
MATNTQKMVERAFVVAGVLLAAAALWLLSDVVLVIVGAVLVAVLLQVVAEPFRWLRLPHGLALFLSGALVLCVLLGVGFLLGTATAAQLQVVVDRVQEAQSALWRSLQSSDIGRVLLSRMRGAELPLTDIFGRLFSVSANFLVGVVVMVFGGLYLAAQPAVYREGLAKLFPREWRGEVEDTVDAVARALRLWLFGQMIEMIIIGVMSGVAVWLIGLPSPLALGVIAGVAEFVPYLGPIIAAVPAILVAVTLGPAAALWTLVAYLAIHQAEGQLIMPLIQRRMVFVPPAVMLLSIVAIGYAFGVTGAVFAAPITVIVFVMVNKLYVRDALGEEAPLPGEPSGEPSAEGALATASVGRASGD